MRPKYVILAMVVVVSFLAGTLIPTAVTQSATSPQYVQVNYMNVDPAKENAYIQMEREVWKPIHQQRVRDGKMKSWELYAVRYPGGTAREYGYLTVETFNSIQALEGSADAEAEFAALAKKVHPNKNVDQIFAQAFSSRGMVRSEVLKLIDHTN